MAGEWRVFGVRHHGPGSARSVLRALEDYAPDCVLVEGPPDADDRIPLVCAEGMRPPVALLVYRPDEPSSGVFYPFAEFSPEWQALRFGVERGIETRFMDLPQANRLALESADEPRPPEADGDADPGAEISRDPLGTLARAAGFDDGERWWEHVVEHRRGEGAQEVFDAVATAMQELRSDRPDEPDPVEPLREAWMRRLIREAARAHDRVAVVCGAWHAPVLREMPTAKHDQDLLKGLRKVKIESTWIPWTNGRLCAASGYGAGVRSPGWYHHLWTQDDAVSERWMTRVARLFRQQDIDASSAHVIEAHRLAEALAALRGSPIPGLEELTEATRAVMCFGDPLPLALVHDKLMVGERMGEVAADAPALPIQRDIEAQQRSLRLKPTADEQEIDLDLRQPMGLARSHLLHRLLVLDAPWGEPVAAGRTSGSFRERWKLRWSPELALRVIDAGRWGNSVEQAATARAIDQASRAPLDELTRLFGEVLLAELAGAAEPLAERLRDAAALTHDVGQLMDAVLPLARVLRYGSVRQTDAGLVSTLLSGLLTRICVGVPPACRGIDADAASEMLRRIGAAHEAVSLARDVFDGDAWQAVLAQLAEDESASPVLAGRANRLLLDAGVVEIDVVGARMSLALSRAGDPGDAAAWLEGVLAGSGLVLIHDDRLLRILDQWVCALATDRFDEVVPIVRRTFGAFAAPERRQIGESLKRGRAQAARGAEARGFDETRAATVVPVLRLILGGGEGHTDG